MTRRMSRAYFVTGTDTGVGKTIIATGLLGAARSLGLKTIGLKPVAAGCHGERDGVAYNNDALALQDAATMSLDYAAVNPLLLPRPVAPHVAAAEADVHIDVAELAAHFLRVTDSDADLVVVEGAGGWLVPLNDDETLADLCIVLELPVIMVVGMQLGCLNHALLTAAAIHGVGLTLAGWVANCADGEMEALDANIDALQARLSAPLLGRVPHLGADDEAAAYLDINLLDPGLRRDV